MSLFEALKSAFASIVGHKLRSFLTLLGIIFGVATVIVVVSLIEGFNAAKLSPGRCIEIRINKCVALIAQNNAFVIPH